MPLLTMEIPRKGSRRLRGCRTIIFTLAGIRFLSSSGYITLSKNAPLNRKHAPSASSTEDCSATADASVQPWSSNKACSATADAPVQPWSSNKACSATADASLQRLCNKTVIGIRRSMHGDQLADCGPTCGGVPCDTTHTKWRRASHWETVQTSACIWRSLQPEH